MNSSDRKPSRALLAGLILPGMGQIYNGEMFKGLCYFGIFVMSPLLLLRGSLFLPGRLLFAGAALSVFLVLCLYLAAAADALIAARRTAQTGYKLKKYNRWYFYLAFGLFGTVFVNSAVLTATQTRILGFYKIVSASMEPAIKAGDFIIFDMTAYRRQSPKKGDLVIFRYPDDRSKIYCKRIAGLPGDTMKTGAETSATAPVVVPHGSVYVLGDNQGHSDDSRHYGSLPLTEILGKGRQIYFSFGPDQGIRWNRIGMLLP